MGTDHAGIATQMLVERQIATEGKTRHDLAAMPLLTESGNGKSPAVPFQSKFAAWVPVWTGLGIAYHGRGLRCGCANRVYQTCDDGLIYRGKRLVNWDPELGTAISDLEVKNTRTGHLWHLRYPLADGLKTADGEDT